MDTNPVEKFLSNNLLRGKTTRRDMQSRRQVKQFLSNNKWHCIGVCVIGLLTYILAFGYLVYPKRGYDDPVSIGLDGERSLYSGQANFLVSIDIDGGSSGGIITLKRAIAKWPNGKSQALLSTNGMESLIVNRLLAGYGSIVGKNSATFHLSEKLARSGPVTIIGEYSHQGSIKSFSVTMESEFGIPGLIDPVKRQEKRNEEAIKASQKRIEQGFKDRR